MKNVLCIRTCLCLGAFAFALGTQVVWGYEYGNQQDVTVTATESVPFGAWVSTTGVFDDDREVQGYARRFDEHFACVYFHVGSTFELHGVWDTRTNKVHVGLVLPRADMYENTDVFVTRALLGKKYEEHCQSITRAPQ